MSNTPGKSYNSDNKLILSGLSEARDLLRPSETNSVIAELLESMNHRLLVVLKDGENLSGKLHLPKGTNITILSEGKSNIDVQFAERNEIKVRVYGVEGNVNVQGAQLSHIKQTQGHASSIDTGKVILSHTSGNATTEGTGGDVVIRRTGGTATTIGTRGDATISYTAGTATTIDTEGKSVIKRTLSNATSLFTEGDATIENTGGNASIRESCEATIRETSGDAVITAPRGKAEITGVSGDAVMKESHGNASITNVSGAVIVDGGEEEVMIQNTSGPTIFKNRKENEQPKE